MTTVQSFEVNYFSENTYIVYDETKEGVIIDCGCMNKEEQQLISRFVSEQQLTLKRYLCTHLHLDHIFGNQFVWKQYGLKPEASKADVEGLPSPIDQAKAFRLPLAIQEVAVEHFLAGGQIVQFGKTQLEVISVPGHSPGGLAFYNRKNGFVIVGDSLFAGSIGRTDLWGGSQELLQAALRDRILSLPDETIVYPGHGPETRVIDEKFSNPYL
ncbi:MAG: MBL fold metallo-hydrolase [Parabacteroides sp.]|nr:MBL fold metallo-hydrolase [Parabacteroides distasonis]MCI6874713.1 MBL fold metallo-hydrolase [Parabacteroides sp.]MDD6101010.1 MBL fold metallo-hydrolase [bacterium]MDD6765376.1 MBL fold metallo-hydrolase [bacterium]MDD6837746.1 MBL fold metallo-hydrolase [bacterium]